MALITCPECGKEVSDKATACPNCGYPINTVGNNREFDCGIKKDFLFFEGMA